MSQKLKRIFQGRFESYLIAETAYAHEGSYDYLSRQVEAVDCKSADAVKVHMLLNIDGYMKRDHPDYETVKAWLFKPEQWTDILGKVKQRNMDLIVLADDEASMTWLLEHQSLIDAVEIHSTGLNDLHLLKMAAELGKPVFLGVGGSTLDEISLALGTLNDWPTVMMTGFQNYPTDYRKINLRMIAKLAKFFETVVGYADHTAFDDPENEFITLMGYILGAPIIEKHFVLEKGVPRSDYESAVSVSDLEHLKRKLEMIDVCLGHGKMAFSPEEQSYRQSGLMKKVPVARSVLKKGDRLNPEMIVFKRTGVSPPVKPTDIYSMLGMELVRDIHPGEIISFSDLR